MGPAPGRLFHAIVLAGAAMGTGTCHREPLPSPTPPPADAAAVGDAPTDPDCDAKCPPGYFLYQCACVFIEA